MTHEDYVTLEQAKELKRLGFDWDYEKMYALEDIEYEHPLYNGFQFANASELFSGNKYCRWRVVRAVEDFDLKDDLDDFSAPAPTLNQAAKWIREKHHLAVIVKLNGLRTMWFSEVWTMTQNGPVYHEPGVLFESYDEALSH